MAFAQLAPGRTEAVPSQHSPPHPHLHPHDRTGPILRLIWGLFGYLGYLTSWMCSGHITPSAMSNLSMSSHQFYVNSWNNSRAMSVCFIFWGNEGVETVPKTPCRYHWQLRSQAKIGSVKGVHGSKMVLRHCSLSMAEWTSSWSCALHISAVLHQWIKTEPWESASPFCLFMSAKICKKYPSLTGNSSSNWLIYSQSFPFHLQSCAYARGFFFLQSAGKLFLRSFKSLSNFLSLQNDSTWS